MPKRIPIADARRIMKKNRLRQLVMVAWDGEKTHVVTCGTTLHDSEQAALGGNKVKKALGWPEELQKANSRIKQLEANLQQFLGFFDTLPAGWLGKTTGDIGLLNNAYSEARRLGMKIK